MENSAAGTKPAMVSGKRKSFVRRNLSLCIGIVILAFILVIALFPGIFTDIDPTATNVDNMMAPPSSEHIFGTDELGRDVFSRVINGTRIDLQIGFMAALVPLITGTIIGILTGYFGGIIDTIFMRFLDVVMAFPLTILIIAIVAVLGPSISNMYIAMWLVGWTSYARLVRSETMVAKNAEYIQAAKALGYSNFRVMFRHILPNVVSGALVYGISDVLMAILTGASLSFLGVGVQPPTPEWGAIIAAGRSFLTIAPWISISPGIMLVITGVGLSLLGDGLGNFLRIRGK